jgi:hypothetical protein
VDVLGGRENARVHLSDGAGVVDLVARIAESGQAEFIFDPLAEGTGSVRFGSWAGVGCAPGSGGGEGGSEGGYELSAIDGHGTSTARVPPNMRMDGDAGPGSAIQELRAVSFYWRSSVFIGGQHWVLMFPLGRKKSISGRR